MTKKEQAKVANALLFAVTGKLSVSNSFRALKDCEFSTIYLDKELYKAQSLVLLDLFERAGLEAFKLPGTENNITLKFK